MWSAEHAIETGATPEAVWRLWEDVPGWPEWNDDLERAELDGPFAAGSPIRMTSKDGDTIELRIADAVEPERFVDEASLGSVVIRTEHRVEPAGPERTRIVYRMEIGAPRGRHPRAGARPADQRRLPRGPGRARRARRARLSRAER